MGERRARHSPPQPQGPYPNPWLVFEHGRGFRNQTFCTISSHHPPPNLRQQTKHDVRSVPELRNNYVQNSCHGWLILSKVEDDKYHFSLFNPVTLESILVPSCDKLYPDTAIDFSALSSPPTDPSCVLFLFDSGLRRILFCRLENQVWFEKRYDKELGSLEESTRSLCRPFSSRGKLYAATRLGDELVSIETKEQSSTSSSLVVIVTPLGTRLPWGYEPRAFWARRVFVGSGEELFTIQTWYGGRLNREVVSIHVFKLDWTSLIWERVMDNSAKDKVVFFLGSHYSISCPAAVDSDHQGRSCVYFSEEDTGKGLCMYDIADESISLLLPCPNLTTPWRSPFWVMPDLRLPNFNTEALSITGNEEQRKEEGGEDEKEQGSKVVTEKEENEKIEAAKEGLNLVDLPSEILQSISKLLATGDYMNFRAVSTMTRQQSPLIEWRTAMSGSDGCNYPLPSSPWLMNFEKYKGVCSFVDPTRGDRYFVRMPKSLQDAVLCHCKDGWLLLSQGERSPTTEILIQIWLSFFNPFTKEIVEYPALSTVQRLSCGPTHFDFSSVPSSSNCVVVVTTFCYNEVCIHTSRSREEEWHLDVVTYDPVFQPSCSIPIFADKAFYFMGESGNLGVLRIIEEGQGCSWEVLENTKAPCHSFDHNFLAEYDGMLLSIFVGGKGKWVQVFKLNPSTMGWERVESLGNRTLYITSLSALAADAETPKMEEKIFFSRFYGKNVASYSLSTGMHHYSCGGEEGSLKDYYGTKELLSSCWIVPRWH